MPVMSREASDADTTYQHAICACARSFYMYRLHSSFFQQLHMSQFLCKACNTCCEVCAVEVQLVSNEIA